MKLSRVQVVKLVRDNYRTSLREAVEAVDELIGNYADMRNNPGQTDKQRLSYRKDLMEIYKVMLIDYDLGSYDLVANRAKRALEAFNEVA